jgi:hypothetical protein
MLEVHFTDPLTACGSYTMTIGPNIVDQALFPRPMDQDGDLVGGENPDDCYTATFDIRWPDQDWTVMVYIAAGNQLDGNGDGLGGDEYRVHDLMLAIGGDANLDGGVDAFDYIIVKHNYGMTGATWADGDFDYDGDVDRSDFLILQANFGEWISPPPPRVGGSQGWERPDWPDFPTWLTLVFHFSSDVGASLGPEDFVVYNTSNDETYAVPAEGLTYDSETNTATLDLNAAGLDPGWYTITLLAAGVTDGEGTQLDGNGDGAPGDDLVVAGIMVAIPGDANLDGSVDGMDLFILQANWCMSGATWGHGDFNYDTTVDFSDLLIMALHFGESI